ncbi:tetratricopeptide repeat protein [Tolumonas lignilytica]|uniref:tetratricopeptide repeat protein n=1 Tax=Tolumonas lignilytica TaxID=1283284 RepID=UPI0004653F2E|nr:tetratricopeptide repeat protein [Tolumonas lignilytica]
MIVTITPQNFHTELLEASRQKTVAVFFYADQLPECRPMGQQLEQLIGPANPSITLAKVDVADPQLQSLAIQLGLQALPAVVIFKNGQPADALMGPQEPTAIENLLTKYLPKEDDVLLAEGLDLLHNGDAGSAYAVLQKARQLAPQRYEIQVALADACIKSARLDEAETLLNAIPNVYQDSAYQQVKSALDLAQQAADSPEIRSLETQLAADPTNKQLQQDLAIQYSQAGRKQEALDLLFAILSKDLGFGEARKTYQDILATMGADPLVSQYRKKLYSLLY